MSEQADQEDEPYRGDEQTRVGDASLRRLPIEDLSDALPYRGDEYTLVGDSEASVGPYHGDEQTLVGGGDAASADSLPAMAYVGDEITLRDRPVYAGDEATLVGAAQARADASAAPAPYRGDEATLANRAEAEGSSTSPVTVSRSPKMKTTTGFDAGWHLEGRQGPHTGKVWGDFELGGILGEGGMGAVYRGIQLSLKRRVAVKVLPPNLAQDQRLLERFWLEAGTSSRLQSPHVVQVYFIGEAEGNHFFAMEFVDGTDLAEALDQRRADGGLFTNEEVLSYVLQAAKGLEEAGRLQLVHRDIKPHNMMLTADGLLKLTDFGIVKVLGESNLTITGQAVGTPAYVSPEQGRGEEGIDQRSDIYSLGIVFYELACGQRPFSAPSPNALIYKHCFAEPALPRTLNPDISDEMQALIMRCLQKNPEHRYQSAGELIADLERLRQGSLLKSALNNYRMLTGADEARREQLSWIQRHLAAVATAASLIVALGVGGGWWYLSSQAEQDVAAADARSLASRQAAVFDAAQPIPDGAAELIDSYASLVDDGEDDPDVKRWRAKLGRVRELQQVLTAAQLGSERVDAATRVQARGVLEELQGLVGTSDATVSRASADLARLDRVVVELRDQCAGIDVADLRLGARQRFGALVEDFAQLVPSDDADLQRWRRRLDDFDQGLAPLLNRMGSFDALTQVTVTDRNRYQPTLVELRRFLDADDPRLHAWEQRLAGAGERISTLQREIAEIVGLQPARIAIPQQEQVGDKLASYAALVGDDDPQLRDWRAAINAADRALTAARERLSARADDSEGILPKPSFEAVARDLTTLQELAAPDDEDRLRFTRLLADSRQRLAGLEADCAVLDPGSEAELSLAVQADLAPKIELLLAKGAIDITRAEAWRTRLQRQAQRVQELRASLADFDQVAPITATMERRLDALQRAVADDDADLVRWLRKHERVQRLQHTLAPLDQAVAPPEESHALLTQLVELIGEQDAGVLRWRAKLAHIAQLHETLSTLDHREPFDGQRIDSALRELQMLVGGDDAAWRRWQTKHERVVELKTSLRSLQTRISLSADECEQMHARFEELVGELVGASDDESRAAARRLAQLDGPPRPAWAAAEGRDAIGRWAVTELPGGSLRFRWLAAGGFTIGSKDSEPGHSDDELPVRMLLADGFWLAEHETPRAIWQAVMGSDPSWAPMHDALLQPVDRISWHDAHDFITALGDALPGARLPWEPEWEYACRAGSDRPWALDADLPADAVEVAKLAWIADNVVEGAQPSCGRQPNPLGLYDMHGNLAEWCEDGYAAYPTSARLVSGPVSGGIRRVARGGSWGDDHLSTRAANRIALDPDVCSSYLGLRLAVSPDWSGGSATGADLLTRAEAGATDSQPTLHIVVEGDDLVSIARRYFGAEERVDLLKAANPWMAGEEELVAGRWLIIPPAGSRCHRIVAGEGLKDVVDSASVQLSNVLAMNPWIIEDTVLQPGQLLLLPAKGGTTR